MPMRCWTLSVLILACACSDNLKGSYTHQPGESAEITITSQNTVISHEFYRNDSPFDSFKCRRDQGGGVYFDAKIMIQQPNGTRDQQFLQLFFPLVDDTGKTVQQEWDAKKVQLFGRLSEPKYFHDSMDGTLAGTCLANVTRNNLRLAGRIVCTNFQIGGQPNLQAFDLQVSRFDCLLEN